MAGVHFLLGLQLDDLLVIDLLGVGLGDRIMDLDVEEGVAKRAALVILRPAWEALGLVETVLLAGAGHQLVFDDVLQKHALALHRREAGELRAHFRRGKIEIGLLDIDAVDARDDGIVGGGRQWGKANEGCDEQQG